MANCEPGDNKNKNRRKYPEIKKLNGTKRDLSQFFFIPYPGRMVRKVRKYSRRKKSKNMMEKLNFQVIIFDVIID